MSPLSEAIKTELVYVRNNGQHVYKTNGSLDSEWTVGNVPHGGYIATIILSTLLLHQSITKSSHPDIAHLTIQFPSPSIIAPLFLEIITTSISKRWSRLELRSLQYISGLPIVRCTASAIFTTLPELTMATLPTPTEFTLMPHTPSPFARIIPLLSHPSESKARESIGIFNFRKRMNWTRGAKDVRWSNDDKEKTSLDWAGWVQLTDEQEDLRTSSALIGFFSQSPLPFFDTLFHISFSIFMLKRTDTQTNERRFRQLIYSQTASNTCQNHNNPVPPGFQL